MGLPPVLSHTVLKGQHGLCERRCSPSVGTRRDVSWALAVEPPTVSLPYRFWDWPRAPSVMFSVRSLALAWTLPGSRENLKPSCHLSHPAPRGRDVGQVLKDGFEFELDASMICCIFLSAALVSKPSLLKISHFS